jgi:hypothetical protein
MSTTLYKNSSKIMMLAVAGGFAFILAELLGIQHAQGPKLIGTFAAAIGAVLGLVGLSENPRVRRILSILFIVLALSGIYGFTVHSGARGFRGEGAAAVPASEDRTVQRALRSFTLLPPPLAPLALTGLSLMGAAFASIGSAAASERLSMARA